MNTANDTFPDAKGQHVSMQSSTETEDVKASIEGEGRLVGFISSDLRRKTPFTSHEDKTYFGRAMAIVQSTRKAGTIRLRFDVEGWDEPVWVELTSEALPKDYVSDIPSFR